MGARLHPVSRLAPPAIQGKAEVDGFLCWLAHRRGLAASTHQQALTALLFFYRKELGADLPWITEIGIPCVRRRLPARESRPHPMPARRQAPAVAHQASDARTTRLDDRFFADVRLTGIGRTAPVGGSASVSTYWLARLMKSGSAFNPSP